MLPEQEVGGHDIFITSSVIPTPTDEVPEILMEMRRNQAVPQAQTTEQAEALKLGVTVQLASPILKTPAHKQEGLTEREDSPQTETTGTTRSSPRLMGKTKKQTSAVKLAQQVLAKKWGILEEDKELESCTLQKYLDIYKRPLSEPAIEAVRTLSEVVEAKKKRKKNSGKSASKPKKSKKPRGAAPKMQPAAVTGPAT